MSPIEWSHSSGTKAHKQYRTVERRSEYYRHALLELLFVFWIDSLTEAKLWSEEENKPINGPLRQRRWRVFHHDLQPKHRQKGVGEQRDSNKTFRPQREVTYLEIRFFFAPLNPNFTQIFNINYHVNYMPDDYQKQYKMGLTRLSKPTVPFLH